MPCTVVVWSVYGPHTSMWINLKIELVDEIVVGKINLVYFAIGQIGQCILSIQESGICW